MSRRNRLDIMSDILRITSGGAIKTKIVYQANLNFNLCKKYLKKMIDKGLIRQNDNLYFTTHDGHMFLSGYSRIVGAVI